MGKNVYALADFCSALMIHVRLHDVRESARPEMIAIITNPIQCSSDENRIVTGSLYQNRKRDEKQARESGLIPKLRMRLESKLITIKLEPELNGIDSKI
ncbi:hypothetical protein EVAR_81557_1 [Eumeta japonica]|uniref:Uncharacterized protein n=1 Tax=Eumeta variegata TaxID=151549 RepID=A0A4C1UZA1_EUMVA|nr:hypothetical protein EVAR_81557_1 [Eumeta japonica]